MRIAHILEWYTSESVAGISLVNNMLALGRACNQIEPTFFEVPIPPPDSKVEVPEGYFDYPWIRTHPTGDDARSEGYELTPVRPETIAPFRPQKRSGVVVDAVLNAKFLHSASIAMALETSPGRWYQPIEIPVVTHLTESGVDRRLPLLNRDPAHALLRAGVEVGPVVVMEQQDADWLRDRVIGVSTDQLGARIHLVPPIIDAWEIDEHRQTFAEERAGHSTPVAFHGGSLESKRHLTEIAEATTGLMPAVFTTQATPKTSPFPEHVELITGVQRDEYLDLLGRGDVLVCASEYEGTGLAYMEAIRSGMIPVVLDAPWIRSRLPDGYPFVAKDWREFRIALELVTRTWPNAYREWHKSLIEHLDRFSGLEAAGRFLHVMKTIAGPSASHNVQIAMKTKPAFELLANHALSFDELTLPEARKQIKAGSDAGTDFGVSDLAIRWMLIALGFRDACDGPAPRMVR